MKHPFRLPWLRLAFAAAALGPSVPAAGAATAATQAIAMRAGFPAAIEFLQYFDVPPPSGWVPVAFHVRNDSPDDLTWTVRFSGGFQPAGSTLLGEWPLAVPAGTAREFQLLVPLPWLGGLGGFGAVRAEITGPGLGLHALALNASGFYGPRLSGFTGMSQTLAPENWGKLEAELKPASPGGPPSRASGTTLRGARFEPALLPADWRCYSGFVTAWLHRDDWRDLSAAQRLALKRWVFQGGRLYLAGGTPALEDLPGFNQAAPRASGSADAGWRDVGYGFGTVTWLPLADARGGSAALALPLADVAAEIQAHVNDSAALAAMDPAATATDLETAVGEIRPGGFMLGLLVAAIAVLLGPVNLFVLAPARRRARLFLTVPVIALGGGLALMLLILVQDGVGGHGRRGTLIALLPDRAEALVLQEQCSMTGLLLRRDFRLPEDATAVDVSRNVARSVPFLGPAQRPGHPGADRRASELTGAWFSSRSVQSHHLRAFVPTRAALTITAAPNGGLTAQSQCPGTLRDVVLYAADGARWNAAEIPPGRKVELRRGSAVRDDWSRDLRRFGLSLEPAAAAATGPLTFRARVERWDENVPLATLGSIHWQEDALFIRGPVREASP